MTLDEIEARLHEAITTLAALPDRELRWLRGSGTSWPTMLREAADVMGLALERVQQGKAAYEAMTAGRAVPAPEAIDRMDASLRWFTFLDAKQHAIITLRASGMSFERIGWRLKAWGLSRKVSDETVRRWNREALEVVRRRLAGINRLGVDGSPPQAIA